MHKNKPAKKEVKKDRKEPLGLMEPLLIASDSPHRQELADLTLELAAVSSGLKRSLPAGVLRALSELVRAMNCYYSNLIEGHNTHPVDIERALKKEFNKEDREKRNLQREATAHIEVQRWIDEGGIKGRVQTLESIQEIHRKFGKYLPEELLWVEDPDTKKRLKVIPGELRSHDVKVGRHFAISPGAVPRFLKRYEEVYENLGKSEMLLAAAAAHHRLLWIHPFLDGNGRVARLVSHAMLSEILETGSLWSIARGLARNEAAYKQHLIACDAKRRGDLDGRGNLSEEALAQFTKFFLKTCIDQVRFMESLVQPNRLRDRILLWAEEEMRADNLPSGSGLLLEAILFRGEIERGETGKILGLSARSARRIISVLIRRGIFAADSHKAPLRLAFPAALAERWMPGLFPPQT